MAEVAATLQLHLEKPPLALLFTVASVSETTGKPVVRALWK